MVLRPQWLNGQTLKLVKKKAELFNQYHQIRTTQDRLQYARIFDQTKWEVQKAAMEFERHIVMEVKKIPKDFSDMIIAS